MKPNQQVSAGASRRNGDTAHTPRVTPGVGSADRFGRTAADDRDDADEFSGSPEELDALLRHGRPPRSATTRGRWPAGLPFVVAGAAGVALWLIILVVL